MPAHKRTKEQRERDLKRVADLYIMGRPQHEIAAELSVVQSQISYDLKIIKDRWATKTAFDIDALKRRELDRIDLLEATHWDAWNRSKLERVKTRTKRGTKPGGSKKLLAEVETSEASVERETLIGNPAFLAGVMSCIERRCKLLGLDAPTKVANTDIPGERLIPIMVVQPGYMELL